MTENSLWLKIIAPDKVFYEGYAEMVEVDTTEGRIGILPGHIPMTVMLKPGTVTIYEAGGKERKETVSAGFAEILQDKVTVFTIPILTREK